MANNDNHSNLVPSSKEILLELRAITKVFPRVNANDNISLKIHKAEVDVLLGENGAGKATLMNILFGLYQADEGELLINDQKLNFKSPNDAIRNGIEMAIGVQVLDMVHEEDAEIMDVIPSYGVREGCGANLTLLYAMSTEEALRELPRPVYVVKRGNVVVDPIKLVYLLHD